MFNADFQILTAALSALDAHFRKDDQHPLESYMTSRALELVEKARDSAYAELYRIKDQSEDHRIKAEDYDWMKERYNDLHARFIHLAKDDSMWPDEIEAMKTGNKILAIKLYRQRKQAGLKEAKDAIEAYMAANKIGIQIEEAVA